MLWRNIYFPTDPGAGNYDDAELHTAQEIEKVMKKRRF